ncbi:MAG: hypothetical protein RBS43_04595 [Candidatus Cloacimonas sp.]|jgi:hypothetical protein|nr:hypothetical protein [Candidatus Cloacimonas sp.]
MKTYRTYAFIIVLFISVVSVFAQTVDSTFTISANKLNAIRLATSVSSSDDLIRTYWDQYTRTTRENDPDPGVLSGERAFSNSFGLEIRTISLYKNIVSNTPDYSDPYTTDSIRDYLYSFPYETFKLAIFHPGTSILPQTPVAGEVIPSDWDACLTDEVSVSTHLCSYTHACTGKFK